MFHIKRTWQDCKDEKILAVYKEVYEETKRLYPDYFTASLKFYIDGSTSHLGRCEGRYDRSTIYNQWGYKNHFEFLRWESAVILLSKYVTDPESIRRTLVHEFGHFVTPSEHHSSYWLTRANKIGEKWGIKCSKVADQDEAAAFEKNVGPKQTKKYQVVCSGCGKIVSRQKLCDIIKHPENWKCGSCGARFKNI